MKKYIFKLSFFIAIIMSSFSCNNLDLKSLDQADSDNWFSNNEQFRQSLNDGYRGDFWPDLIVGDEYEWSDDMQARNTTTSINTGTIDADNTTVRTWWANTYKGITRSLVIIQELDNQKTLSPADEKQFRGEANFLRACYYSFLITNWGDVPFYEKPLTIDESYELNRTNKNDILKKIYEYFDIAIANLPVSYGTGFRYATKGAALAYKARIALYMGDYATAATASKACMDLGAYTLHPNYGDLFLPPTKNSKETVFAIPRNKALDVILVARAAQKLVPRTLGGFGQEQPTWQLLAAYQCKDGLPIDKSPLFDPRNPFKNRDPRCAMTIVPFGSLTDGDGLLPSSGSRHLDIEYNPHPTMKRIMDYKTGALRTNNDTRSIVQWASFNGLYWKKGIDLSYVDLKTDPDRLLMRYADVLLMYAEAKIELNQLDASVLDAMNLVRARAYSSAAYPKITTLNQAQLRKEVRYERRVEFPHEGLRWFDLVRWRLAEKALTGNIYGMLDVVANANTAVPPTGPIMDILVKPGLWFWGLTPTIGDDGLPNLDNLYNAGLSRVLTTMKFDKKAYLLPIPNPERDIMPQLTQNPGY